MFYTFPVIAITGGAGYVGTALVDWLNSSGISCKIIDNFWFGNPFLETNMNCIIKKDVREITELDLSDCQIVIHLASIANDPSVDLNPMLSWEIGTLGTRNVCESALKAGAQRIILASSGSVYGVRGENKVTEEISLTPISVYNKVKMIKERIALSYGDQMSVTVLRPATICGKSRTMRLDLAVNALTYSAVKFGRMYLDGGDQIRPQLHIDDMVQVYRFFIENNLPGIYNVGFENITLREISERIRRLTGAAVVDSGQKDSRSYRLNSDKLLNRGFIPIKNLDVGISELIDLFRSDFVQDDSQYRINWLKQREQLNDVS